MIRVRSDDHYDSDDELMNPYPHFQEVHMNLEKAVTAPRLDKRGLRRSSNEGFTHISGWSVESQIGGFKSLAPTGGHSVESDIPTEGPPEVLMNQV